MIINIVSGQQALRDSLKLSNKAWTVIGAKTKRKQNVQS